MSRRWPATTSGRSDWRFPVPNNVPSLPHCLASCSACWRGFVCSYLVEGPRLLLDSLEMSLDGPAPKLFGVRPKPLKGDFTIFDAVYEGLGHRVPFSGGLLLADDFIDELYVHMGFHPAWKYREVHELVFLDGDLVLEADRSEQIAEFRDAEASVQAASEKARARFVKRKQLMPRERIALLLDRGAPFLELMPLAGYRMHDDKDGSSAGGGSVAGIGYVEGVRCVVSA